MNLVSWLQRLMTNFGAGWVMWLLVELSVLSVAVMLERAWFYWSLRDDLAKLAHSLRERLRANDIDGAKKLMESSPSAEAAAVPAGLLEADRGAKAAEEAMTGAQALQRIKLERRLAFLGTLGNNAPFIGLFGTVIGVVQAFVIQMELEGISRSRTTLVIAHRLSTVVHADQILVMDHGRIVERGTHEDLLARRGAYAPMWDIQSREREKSEASPEVMRAA